MHYKRFYHLWSSFVVSGAALAGQCYYHQLHGSTYIPYSRNLGPIREVQRKWLLSADKDGRPMSCTPTNPPSSLQLVISTHVSVPRMHFAATRLFCITTRCVCTTTTSTSNRFNIQAPPPRKLTLTDSSSKARRCNSKSSSETFLQGFQNKGDNSKNIARVKTEPGYWF